MENKRLVVKINIGEMLNATTIIGKDKRIYYFDASQIGFPSIVGISTKIDADEIHKRRAQECIINSIRMIRMFKPKTVGDLHKHKGEWGFSKRWLEYTNSKEEYDKEIEGIDWIEETNGVINQN